MEVKVEEEKSREDSMKKHHAFASATLTLLFYISPTP
jgi:hypothetical protein